MLQEMLKPSFPSCVLAQAENRTVGVTCPIGTGKKEGEFSNPRGCGPPSVTSSIPPRPYQNPSDSSPHYLPISGLAPPLVRVEMKGFRGKNRGK